MRKLLIALLALVLLTVPALADQGAADVEFNGETHHFTYEGAEIIDGALTVKAHSDDGLPVIGSVPRTPAMAVAEIAGARVMPHTVNVNINEGQVDYTYTYSSDALPDAVWLYPDGKEDGAVLFWQADDTERGGDADVEAAEDVEATIPAELVGAWQGVGTPKNGGTPIDLSIIVNVDGTGTGEYTFDQGGYHESYPFTISNDDSTFSVDIPATSQLGSVGGTWALEEGVLKLDITTTFSNGGSYSYTAECEKVEADGDAAVDDEASDTATVSLPPAESADLAGEPTSTPKPIPEEVSEPTAEPESSPTPLPAPEAEEEISQLKQLNAVFEALGDDVYRTTYEALMADEVVEKGSRGDIAKGVQQTLVAFGRNIAVDGSVGPKTIAALNAVQAAFGLEQTEKLGAEEYALLLPRLLLYTDSDAAYQTFYAQYDGSGEYEYMSACVSALQGRFATAKKAFEHCEWGDWEARAEACVQPWPKTGVLYRNPAVKGSSTELTVKFNTDPDTAMLVKVYTADGVLARTMFIGGTGKATCSLPAGTYVIKDGVGKNWYGEEEAFGERPEGQYEIMTFEDGSQEVQLKKNYRSTITVNVQEDNPNAEGVGSDWESWSDF